MIDFEARMADTAMIVEQKLDQILQFADGPEDQVMQAMRYACLAGGKRLRPFLVLTTSALFNVAQEFSLRAAAAVELIHCYSLVHDDLPVMDDDDLRRGRPTCHRYFDEPTAILAGDGLLTLAFEVLAAPQTHHKACIRAELCLALARAGGAQGMVGGQMIDLAAENKILDIEAITHLQRLKTGALIDISCQFGAILGEANPQNRQALHHYAHDVGLAFQIRDDLLDYESSTEELGKATQKDAKIGKATFVSVLGVEQARLRASDLVDQAIQHLNPFDADLAAPLVSIARFSVERRA